MSEESKTAQVHRFRERVAISVGLGETVYLTYREARLLAKGLNATAKSVESESFAKSELKPFTINIQDAGSPR